MTVCADYKKKRHCLYSTFCISVKHYTGEVTFELGGKNYEAVLGEVWIQTPLKETGKDSRNFLLLVVLIPVIVPICLIVIVIAIVVTCKVCHVVVN